MSARHTPGPWHIAENRAGFQICEPRETTVAAAHRRPAGYNNTSEQEANARLISAAPDLLEACKALADFLYRDDARPLDAIVVAELARGAIAKAEGSE